MKCNRISSKSNLKNEYISYSPWRCHIFSPVCLKSLVSVNDHCSSITVKTTRDLTPEHATYLLPDVYLVLWRSKGEYRLNLQEYKNDALLYKTDVSLFRRAIMCKTNIQLSFYIGISIKNLYYRECPHISRRRQSSLLASR